jgi:Coenzyme PQQ synthesis protein D (PqqD)
MIRGDDRVSLAPGVRLSDYGLADVLHEGDTLVTLNPSGRNIATLFDGRPLRDVGAAIVARYGIDAQRAERDARILAADLNRRLMVNVQPRAGELARLSRWITQSIRGIPLLIVPSLRDLPSARWPLPIGRPLATVAVVTRHTVPRVALLGLMLVLPIVLMLGVLGALRPEIPFALLVGLTTGLVAHEAGHALALRRGPAAIGLNGITVFIMHPPLRGAHRAIVAAGGPLMATAIGWALLFVALVTQSTPLALTASLLTFQALGLTVLGHDGRKACGLS